MAIQTFFSNSINHLKIKGIGQPSRQVMSRIKTMSVSELEHFIEMCKARINEHKRAIALYSRAFNSEISPSRITVHFLCGQEDVSVDLKLGPALNAEAAVNAHLKDMFQRLAELHQFLEIAVTAVLETTERQLELVTEK